MTDAAKSPWILDATLENFQAEVIDRSHEMLIIIDFWADWCQPCKVLAPILEKLAIEFDGQLLLVKANTEPLQAIAAQFNVQSIPAVFAMRDAQVLDFFEGVLPEDALRDWITRQLPSEAEKLVVEAKALGSEDLAASESKLRAAIELDEKLFTAQIALAENLVEQNRDDDAQAIVDELEKRGFLEPEAERVKASLELRRQGSEAGDVEPCRATLAADPKNTEAKLKLAEALAATQQYEEALQLGLEVVQQDKTNFGEPARVLMVDIFKILPGDSELTGEYRRKLGSALY